MIIFREAGANSAKKFGELDYGDIFKYEPEEGAYFMRVCIPESNYNAIRLTDGDGAVSFYDKDPVQVVDAIMTIV